MKGKCFSQLQINENYEISVLSTLLFYLFFLRNSEVCGLPSLHVVDFSCSVNSTTAQCNFLEKKITSLYLILPLLCNTYIVKRSFPNLPWLLHSRRVGEQSFCVTNSNEEIKQCYLEKKHGKSFHLDSSVRLVLKGNTARN